MTELDKPLSEKQVLAKAGRLIKGRIRVRRSSSP
jgi:hypothetical protein